MDLETDERYNKIHSLLGLCIKAGKLVFGVDNILKSATLTKLVLYDNALSQNGVDKIVNKFANSRIKIQCVPFCLATLVHKESCKAVAVIDKNFADGILAVLSKSS